MLPQTNTQTHLHIRTPPPSPHIQANNGNEVSSLASLLLAVGRYHSLQAAYISSRAPLIAAMWDEAAAMLASSGSSGAAASGSAAAVAAVGGASAGGLSGGWLLLLYNNLLGLLEGDAAWLGSCLEQQRQQLLVALFTAAFDKVSEFLWGGGATGVVPTVCDLKAVGGGNAGGLLCR